MPAVTKEPMAAKMWSRAPPTILNEYALVGSSRAPRAAGPRACCRAGCGLARGWCGGSVGGPLSRRGRGDGGPPRQENGDSGLGDLRTDTAAVLGRREGFGAGTAAVLERRVVGRAIGGACGAGGCARRGAGGGAGRGRGGGASCGRETWGKERTGCGDGRGEVLGEGDGGWREVGAAASGGRVTGAELVGGRVKGPGWRASPKRTPAAGERRLSAAGREPKTASKRARMSLKAGARVVGWLGPRAEQRARAGRRCGRGWRSRRGR